jgi:hypothetical protein
VASIKPDRRDDRDWYPSAGMEATRRRQAGHRHRRIFIERPKG